MKVPSPELETSICHSNALQARIKQANLPVEKDPDSFDFSAIPWPNKQKILELARGEWITNHANVCLLGEPETGKAHRAMSLVATAFRQGRSVAKKPFEGSHASSTLAVQLRTTKEPTTGFAPA